MIIYYNNGFKLIVKKKINIIYLFISNNIYEIEREIKKEKQI